MRRNLEICLVLALAVIAAYWPVYRYEFVSYDDVRDVSQNRFVRDGFSVEGVIHSFTSVTHGNWIPLTSLSHMLDCQLFGLKAGWHHAVNVLLHVANTLLLFIVMQGMTGARWRSALVAALFGLHPQHVESVAWIAERKDVLSTLFFMLTLLAYHRYVRRPGAGRYVLVAVLMALGLMAKPMLVTLPLVLLLIDYWPLGRWRAKSEEQRAESKEQALETDEHEAAYVIRLPNLPLSPSPPRPLSSGAWLAVEKLPLLLLSVISAVITYIVQQQAGAMGMLGEEPSLDLRAANALAACTTYLYKTVWPNPLVVFYPYVRRPLINIDFLAQAIAVGVFTVLAVRSARTQRYLPVGWFWYLITLVPVLGLIQVGAQSMADRYTYIPLIGIFIIVAWGGAELVAGWNIASKAAAAAAMLLACGLLTLRQATYWADSETLFRHAATAVPNNFFARDSLAMALWEKDRLPEAAKEFEEALKIVPNLEPSHRKLGVLRSIQGNEEEAIKQLREAIRCQPRQPEPYRHLAWLLATHPNETFRDGKEAVRLAEKARELVPSDDPAYPLYLDTLAAAYAEDGRFTDAVKTAGQAADLAERSGDKKLAEDVLKRLSFYTAGRAFHAPPVKPRSL